MNVTDVRMLGAVVRKRRLALGWTQERAAVAAGVSRPWLSEFEQGKASVEIGLVFAVLDVLGLHLNVVAAEASRPQGAATQRYALQQRGTDVSPASVGVVRTGRKGYAGQKAKRSVTKKFGDSPKPEVDGRVLRSAITMGGRSILSARARSPIDAEVNPAGSKSAASRKK